MKNKFKKFKYLAGSIFRNSKTFYFLNGLIVGVLFYFYSEDVYERQLFQALAEKVQKDLPPSSNIAEDTVILRSVNLIHHLEANRQAIFSESHFTGFKAQYIQPVSFDLMTGKGYCGSNSYVLGRLLMQMGYPIRFAQMKVGGVYGGHIILETKVRGRWIVLDALYDLHFKNIKGNYASFSEVKNNWKYYVQQLPLNYDSSYRYADVRYTNWDKVPILMPLLRRALVMIYGEEKVSTISLRVFVLRKFHFLFIVSLILYFFLHLIRMYIFRKEKYTSWKDWFHKLRTQ